MAITIPTSVLKLIKFRIENPSQYAMLVSDWSGDHGRMSVSGSSRIYEPKLYSSTTGAILGEYAPNTYPATASDMYTLWGLDGFVENGACKLWSCPVRPSDLSGEYVYIGSSKIVDANGGDYEDSHYYGNTSSDIVLNMVSKFGYQVIAPFITTKNLIEYELTASESSPRIFRRYTCVCSRKPSSGTTELATTELDEVSRFFAPICHANGSPIMDGDTFGECTFRSTGDTDPSSRIIAVPKWDPITGYTFDLRFYYYVIPNSNRTTPIPALDTPNTALRLPGQGRAIGDKPAFSVTTTMDAQSNSNVPDSDRVWLGDIIGRYDSGYVPDGAYQPPSRADAAVADRSMKVPLVTRWSDDLRNVMATESDPLALEKTALTAAAVKKYTEAVGVHVKNYVNGIADLLGQYVTRKVGSVFSANSVTFSGTIYAEQNLAFFAKPGVYRVVKGDAYLDGINGVPTGIGAIPSLLEDWTGYLVVYRIDDDNNFLVPESELDRTSCESGKVRIRQVFYPDDPEHQSPLTRIGSADSVTGLLDGVKTILYGYCDSDGVTIGMDRFDSGGSDIIPDNAESATIVPAGLSDYASKYPLFKTSPANSRPGHETYVLGKRSSDKLVLSWSEWESMGGGEGVDAEFVTEVPSAVNMEAGRLYINTSDNCAYILNGTTVQRIGTPVQSTIDSTSTDHDSDAATISAIKEHVSSKFQSTIDTSATEHDGDGATIGAIKNHVTTAINSKTMTRVWLTTDVSQAAPNTIYESYGSHTVTLPAPSTVPLGTRIVLEQHVTPGVAGTTTIPHGIVKCTYALTPTDSAVTYRQITTPETTIVDDVEVATGNSIRYQFEVIDSGAYNDNGPFPEWIMTKIVTIDQASVDLLSRIRDLETGLGITNGSVSRLDASVGSLEQTTVPGLRNCLVPIGSVVWYFGSVSDVDTMTNWMVANGSELDATGYPELAAVLGTVTVGGASKITLPNLTDSRYVQGNTTAGRTIVAAVPNLSGSLVAGRVKRGATFSSNTCADGTLFRATARETSFDFDTNDTTASAMLQMSFNASRVSSVYSDVDTVTPKSLTAIPIIRVR